MQFTPNLDALNKKNALAESTASKIPQRSAPKFGAKSCKKLVPLFISSHWISVVGFSRRNSPAWSHFVLIRLVLDFLTIAMQGRIYLLKPQWIDLEEAGRDVLLSSVHSFLQTSR